jgi:uncharacterized protein YajQ (UPF0234 family)
MAEVDNALNNVRREMLQRYDFKGSKGAVERTGDTITVLADDDMKLRAMQEMLFSHLARRGVELGALEQKTPQKAAGESLRQTIMVRQGIDQDLAKKISKAIRDSKLKVQATVQGNELRVSGKQRDDLQDVIALVKEMKLEQPLQYVNFRD